MKDSEDDVLHQIHLIEENIHLKAVLLGRVRYRQRTEEIIGEISKLEEELGKLRDVLMLFSCRTALPDSTQ